MKAARAQDAHDVHYWYVAMSSGHEAVQCLEIAGLENILTPGVNAEDGELPEQPLF